MSVSESDGSASLQRTEHAIIGGVEDNTVGHLGVVSLYQDVQSIGYVSYSGCTGTLIHPQWVLTAAHCVAELRDGKPVAVSRNKYYKVAIGTNADNLRSNMYAIDKIIFHPDYYTKYINVGSSAYYTAGNDVALVKLKKAVPAKEAKPIKTLPKWLGIKRADLKGEGLIAEFVGFGYDEFGLSDTKLHVLSYVMDYCGAANNDPSVGCKHGEVLVNGCHPSPSMCDDPSYKKYCSTGRFCFKDAVDRVWLSHGTLYFEKDPGGTCQGDSGGPAMVRIGGEEYVAGLTSYGDAACAKDSVSTATQDFYDWIIEQAPEVAEAYVEICGNGVDDDGNGLSDCADPVCASTEGCGPEDCGNGVDDNKNGLVDCNDPVCAKDSACSIIFEYGDKENCSNGIDDNLDGDVDCFDAQCKNTDRCKKLNEYEEEYISSGCQAAPNVPSKLPLGMILLGMIGAGAILRRRNRVSE